MYQNLKIEKSNGIATVTFTRPQAGNALDVQSYADLYDAIVECGADDEVRVIIITGEGKHFCAGGDIRMMKALIEQGGGLDTMGIRRAGETAELIRKCPKPVIAMINGAAVGAGCSIAAACDFRVMAPHSMISMAFINMGFSGDTGGMYYLAQILGPAKTAEMMALGEPIDGTECKRLGFATRLAESDETLLETTMKLAKKLVNSPGAAIAMQKRLQYEFFYRELPQFTLREADYMHESSLTADHREAVDAFLSKRRPVFQGK